MFLDIARDEGVTERLDISPTCERRCVNAKSPPNKCKCKKCRGQHHGINRRNDLNFDHDLNSFEELRKISASARCLMCEEPLVSADIRGYEHSHGLDMPTLGRRLWVYYVCPKCHYQNALSKLMKVAMP